MAPRNVAPIMSLRMQHSSPQAEAEAEMRIAPVRFEPSLPPQRPRGLLRLYQAAVVVGMTFVLLFAFLQASTSVTVQTSPQGRIDVQGGWRGALALPVGASVLLLPGSYDVVVEAPGYELLRRRIDVHFGGPQRFSWSLQKLPGILALRSTPAAVVSVNGKRIGNAPGNLRLPAGEHVLRLDADYFHPLVQRVRIDGLGRTQSLSVRLAPASALLRIPTLPAGAEVRLGERTLGRSDAPVRVPAGDHLLVLKLPGHRARGVQVNVVAGRDASLPVQQLEPANGLVEVRSTPAGAFVEVDGQFRGVAPLELSLQPGRSYQIGARKPGFTASERRVEVASERDVRVELALVPEYGEVALTIEPADAQVFVDGSNRGRASTLPRLRLDSRAHVIEARKDGFVSQRTTVVPRAALAQEVRFRLVSLDEARQVSSAREIRTASGQRLRLVYPRTFTMGSPPREPGRRSNEVLREVEMTRPFYVSVLEVSNAEFRRFRPQHDSGEYQAVSLNDDSLPVVNVGWGDAAAYCNWLSAREGLPPFYRIAGGSVAGYDATATGYRLATEAEWEYTARYSPGGQLRFPWGAALPPPNRTGNYADRAAAALVGRILVNYVDGAVGPSPVGRFTASALGLRDLGGNVSEWTNDFYEVPVNARVANPLGPSAGQFHVIKGSSWMHGTATELRLAFRDFGKDGRADVGFRIARFAE